MLSYARQYAAEVTQRAANMEHANGTSGSEDTGVSNTDTDTSIANLSVSSVINTTTEPPSDILNTRDSDAETVSSVIDNDFTSHSAIRADSGVIDLSHILDSESVIVDGRTSGVSDEIEITGASYNHQSANLLNSIPSRDHDESTENSDEQPGAIRRGVWSPPPWPLSREELLGEVGDINSRDRNQATRSVPNPTCSIGLSTCNSELLNSRSKVGTNSASASVKSSRSETEVSNSASQENSAALQYSGTPMLTRFLQTPKSSQNQTNSNENRSSSGFPNIRERLQTSIPLSSCDNSRRTGPVRVLSSRGKIPVVTVVSASEASPSISSIAESQRTVYGSMLQSNSSGGAGIISGLSSAAETDVLASLTQPPQLTSNSITSNLINRTDSAHSISSEPTGLSVLSSYPPIVPTVIASTSSHASLFQNIYHNSRGTFNYSTRGGLGVGQIRTTTLSSSRTQPYLQNRSRYLSLLAPYTTEGRAGILNRSAENSQEDSTLASHAVSSLGNRSLTGLTPDLNRVSYPDGQSRNSNLRPPLPVMTSTTPYNPLEASDTESELNTHLHNRAYFLPISEEQTRTVSSTSVQSASSLDSSDTLATRQRSVSRGSTDNSVQGQMSSTDLTSTNAGSATNDFVQDMHRLSRNSLLDEGRLQVPTNSQPNLTNMYVTNQDNNNNTILMTENRGNLNSTRQGPEPFLALRDNLVSMTDQIEQEMNELNRRINALRDSFNQSLQALRQDRERYQTLGHSLTDTSTNLGPTAAPMTREDSPRVDSSVENVTSPVITVTRLEDDWREEREDVTVSGQQQGISFTPYGKCSKIS